MAPSRQLAAGWTAGSFLERLRLASREGKLPAGDPEALVEPALAAGVIDLQEAALVREAAEARRDAIRVDSFTLEEYLGITESFPAARVAATA